MGRNAYVDTLIQIAQDEYNTYGSLKESDLNLLKRIYFYCDTLEIKRPSQISKFQWSATFVSWCIHQAGTTAKEFKFSVRHTIFVHWAIQNAKAKNGLFWGHPITNYAPLEGDLIHYNQPGGKLTFKDVEAKDTGHSHSAIVVRIETQGGKRYAVTIGGNEGDSVGESRHELGHNGKLVQRTKQSYISVIENRKTASSSPMLMAASALAVAAPAGAAAVAQAGGLTPAFRGHGTFIYDTPATIKEYGSGANLIAALKELGMSHIWVRIHGTTAYDTGKKATIKNFINAARAQNIAVAGWGWNQGVSASGDAKLALAELKYFGLSDYIADIEQGHHNADWTVKEIVEYCSLIRKDLSGSFGITTFPLIDWHEPALMQAALPYVDMFNPQVYWFNFPNAKMRKQFKRPDGSQYGLDDPVQYAELCLDRWDKLMGQTPRAIVMSGQAYWKEGGLPQSEAEEKLDAFVSTFGSYDRIVGLNWWHFGGGAAMSHGMYAALKAAKLDAKPYKP